jgi:N-acetylmuramoyl-L-alanine amidase
MKNKALRRLIYGLSLLLASLPTLLFASNSVSQKDTVTAGGYKIKTIIVDPGHGVRPAGATGHFSPGAPGSYSFERNVTLAIGLKLQVAIEKQMDGVKAVLTRSTEEDVNWQKRADIANANKGDLFISLHCNSLGDRHVRELIGHKHGKAIYRTEEVPDRSGQGVLILVYGSWRTKEEEKAIKENLVEGDSEMNADPDPNDPAAMILMNEYKRKYRKQSVHLAQLLISEFTADGRKIEGIREQGVLVLCHSAMPAVLIETGYINNPEDEAYLNSEKGQDEIVASIIRALENYKDEVESVTEAK